MRLVIPHGHWLAVLVLLLVLADMQWPVIPPLLAIGLLLVFCVLALVSSPARKKG